jgi:hypothetical protein
MFFRMLLKGSSAPTPSPTLLLYLPYVVISYLYYKDANLRILREEK